MVIGGVTGVYEKIYLNDNIYIMKYSHLIDGFYDDETGKFYDGLYNEIPFVKDVEALESKENKFYYGFISYDDLSKRFNALGLDFNDNNVDFLYKFSQELSSKMLLVLVLKDEKDKILNTVLTEFDYNNIQTNAMKDYIEMRDEKNQIFQEIIEKIDLRSLEDAINIIKEKISSVEDLNLLKMIYENLYDSTIEILKECDLLIKESLYKQNKKERDPNFRIDNMVAIEADKLIEMLKEHVFTLDEIKTIHNGYTTYSSQLESIIELINQEISRLEESISDEELEEEQIESKKRKSIIKDFEQEYSLDDLKSLRAKVKEYLVGQDEPLRQLTLELSRMKDKELEDNTGILLSGDSGVGKTFMVELIAECLDIPFVKVDSTSLTTPICAGKELEEVIYELYEASGRDVEKAEHGIVLVQKIDDFNNQDDISSQAILNYLIRLLDGSDIYAYKNTKGIISDEVKINSKNMIIIVAGKFPEVYKEKSKMGFYNESKIANSKTSPSTNDFVEKSLLSENVINKLPIRIRLNSLTEKDYEQNLKKGEASPIKWEEISFSQNNVQLKVTRGFIKKASQLSKKEDSGFRGSKGIILRATSNALDDVKEHPGEYSKIILTEATVDNPKIYRRVRKK